MARRSFWFAVQALAVLTMVWGSMPAVAADDAPPQLEPVRLAMEPVDQQRVWIEPAGPNTSQSANIDVTATGEQDAVQPLVFECHLSGSPLSIAFLSVAVTDSAGTTLYTDQTQVYISEDVTSYSLKWDAAAVPVGVYKAAFTLTKLPKLPVTTREYQIHKVSRSQLVAAIQDAQTRLAGAVESVRALQATGQKPPYLIARAAIAEGCGKYISATLDSNPWRTTDRLTRYIGTTAESLRAQLTFLSQLSEFAQPIGEPPMADVEFRDGVIYAGGRPVFLFGTNFGANMPADELSVLRSYGLNLASFEISPRQTSSGEGAVQKLDATLKQATDNNIALMPALSPQNLPDVPELTDPQLKRSDITKPEARQLIEKHLRQVVPTLAQNSMVAAMSVATEPQFRFTGEEVRQGFLAYIKQIYKDTHAINQSWHALFADLNELAGGWDRDKPEFKRSARYIEKPAYQYDWQTYQQQLGTQYLQGVTAFVKSLAPNMPLFVTYSDDILDLGASQYGIDHEAMGALFDAIGCCASNTISDDSYALGYPQQPLIYTLLRSLAPGHPLINACDGAIPPYDPQLPCSFDYVHTVMWEAAMAGLDASAATVDNWMMVPECLDGYVTTCLDLNRLADIVAAFQKEEASVAILWSMPSKIYAKGDPYLESVKYAYEGCSFSGYKLRFISENQILAGELSKVSVLVLPETPSVKDKTFELIKEYVQNNGAVIRTGAPILFDEHGKSRRDIITTSPRTVLLRGQNQPTEYLHCMDAAVSLGTLPHVPRTVNAYGYPLEGVRTRYIEHNGTGYLYVVNLRREPVECNLSSGPLTGRDLIHGQDSSFPMMLQPLRPILVRADALPNVAPPTALVGAPTVPPQL